MAYILRYNSGNNKEVLNKKEKYSIEEAANGHEYVDLGLPSGTLWAKYNIGATNEYEPGLVFYWGDPVGMQVGETNIETHPYKFGTKDESEEFEYTKYNSKDGKITLDLEDDIARVNMGGKWQMPTLEQVQELTENTTFILNDQEDENNKKYCTITSNINNEFIVLYVSNNATVAEVWMNHILKDQFDTNLLSALGLRVGKKKLMQMVMDVYGAWPYIREDILPVRGVLKIN